MVIKMESYIDIHSHILPGVDDGAKNFEMSLRMMAQASKEQISDMILTPHFKPMRRNPLPDRIEEIYHELEERRREAGIPLQLHLGSEIYYSSEIISILEAGRAYTMCDTAYVLVEFSPREDYAYIRDAVYCLMAEGYAPILAHVERYSCLMEKKDRAEELYDMGCYLQINASSITGGNGLMSKRDVKWLLRQELVHFVGSDCHDDKKRTPGLAGAAEYVAKKYGETYCKKIFRDNANALLHGRYL